MRPPFRTAALLAALALLPAAARAQGRLTLADARAKALETNKDIARARLAREQTAHDARAYKSNYYPRVSLVATDFYSTAKGDLTIAGGRLPIYTLNPATGGYAPAVTPNADGSYTLSQYADFPDQKLTYKAKNTFIGGIALQQPLYTGGKITAAYDMARIGEQMATENIRLSESEVLVRTDAAYVQAVRAKELAAVARSYKALLDELLRNVQSAVSHGMKIRNDLLKVQVKLNEAELSIQRADNAYRLARMNLCHVVGLPLDTPVEVDAPEPSAQAAPAGTATAAQRPEQAILQQKADLAARQVGLTRSDYLPALALVAGYTYANGGEIAGRKLIDNASATVGVTLSVPLLTFGERGSKVRAAKARHEIARLEQQDLDEQMSLELAQCRNNLGEAHTEVQLCERAREQAGENLRLSQRQYDNGLEPLSDLLDAQALWQQSSADLIDARCQLLLANTKLLKAQGLLR